jgi:RimJ/RimL family protein N-acetyltransferase
MQVFPNEWNSVITELLREKLIKAKDNAVGATRSVVELNTRVNFVFDRDTFLKTRDGKTNHDRKIRILNTTQEIYDQMNGSVVPRAFWNSAQQFIEKGVSFSLYYDGKMAATSFSSFVAPGKLELGIETLPAYRGLGIAERVCEALIEYCLEKDVEPIWACRLENTGSYRLAQKLGFRPLLELPYYRLSN